MSMRDNRLVAGVVLIIIGGISLIQNLDLLPLSGGRIVALLFLLGGAALFASGRKEQSAFKFYSGIAAMLVGFSIIAGDMDILPGQVIGTAYLWTAASLFLRAHLNRRDSYWPLIPAGILYTVGLVITLEGFRLVRDETTAALICLGIAATFGYLYFVRNQQNKLGWAKYPATIMVSVALIVYFSGHHYGLEPVIFASALILAGIVLIIRTVHADQRVVANDHMT